MRSSTRRSSRENIDDASRILVGLSSNHVGKESSTSVVVDPPLQKYDDSKDTRHYYFLDKENGLIDHSLGEETGRSVTFNDHAIDADGIDIAMSLLSLKSSSDTQRKAGKTVRFHENVHVREYMRCCGDAPAVAKNPLGPTLKYALGLTWIVSSESTTYLNDKFLGAPKPNPLSEEARCRLLVDTIGADNLVKELAQQKNLRTNSRTIKSIEKEMRGFLVKSASSAP